MTRERVLEIIHDPALVPEAGTAEHAAFEAALAAAPDLAQMYEQQQALDLALGTWDEVEPSAGFDRAVIERVEDAAQPWWSRLFGWTPTRKPVAAAAGLAAAAVIGIAVWDAEDSRVPEVVETPAVAPVEAVPEPPAPVVEEEEPPVLEDIVPQVAVYEESDELPVELIDADLEELDEALDDLEMLADFDLLAFDEEPAD